MTTVQIQLIVVSVRITVRLHGTIVGPTGRTDCSLSTSVNQINVAC